MRQSLFFRVAALGFALLAWMGFIIPAQAGEKAEIVGAQISQENGNLQVSFQVVHCFTQSMEEAILSGVPTTFRIRAIIEKPGVLFMSTQMIDVVLEHTVKYDYLKNEFVVKMPENPSPEMVTKDFREAKRWMSTVKELPLIPLWRLQKDQTYQLNLRAELSKVELPLFFRYIFFFVSLWDFDTDWYRMEFSV
jgi:hypothetical protein